MMRICAEYRQSRQLPPALHSSTRGRERQREQHSDELPSFSRSRSTILAMNSTSRLRMPDKRSYLVLTKLASTPTREWP